MHYAASKQAIIICANVHTARAKAKYAHNHVTAESAQPRNHSKCARPSPVFWVGSGHETNIYTCMYMYKCIYSSDLVIEKSHPASKNCMTPVSARTCSDLVIENKSHPASNKTSICEILHVAIWS